MKLPGEEGLPEEGREGGIEDDERTGLDDRGKELAPIVFAWVKPEGVTGIKIAHDDSVWEREDGGDVYIGGSGWGRGNVDVYEREWFGE